MNEDYRSLSDKVFDRLEEDILSGKYKKGETLKEKSLSEEYGVSRTPVREALRQLELEGLVSMIPNRGARVAGFSPEDIHDMYEIRFHAGGHGARPKRQNTLRPGRSKNWRKLFT